MNRIILLILIILCFSLNASDKSSSRNETSKRELGEMQFEITSSGIDFGEIDPENNETIKNNAVSIIIKSDVNWILTVKAENDLVSDDGSYIPVNHLFIRTFKSRFLPIKINRSVIIASGMSTDKNGEEIILDFKLKLGKYNTSGDYSTRIYFELLSAF